MEGDPSHQEQEAVEFANRAVHFDNGGQHEAAIFYYQEAAQALLTAQSLGSQLPDLQNKVAEYSRRCKTLKDQLNKANIQNVQLNQNEEKHELGRAEFLLHQAFDEDEGGNRREAADLYTQAVDLCLKSRSKTKDKALYLKLTKLAEQALERAENLKGVTPTSPKEPPGSADPSTSVVMPSKPVSSRPVHAARVIPPLGFGNLNFGPPSNAPQAKQPASGLASQYHLHVSGSDSYSKEEIEVLRLTSLINGREYVPFTLGDLKERFGYPIPFSDKDGKLALSPKQRAAFSKWVRPEEICPNPKMIELIDCFSIKQTVVSDCSFVASLAISAQYEKRFKKKLITSIIYPQNRNGDPLYNPCGKYMIKFHINGVQRKIIVDDFLPIGNNGELLCSYSTNRNELWISLLEKAYMKVMGGYDFPGSNSNIDLHALTGWIPERVAIKPDDKDSDKDHIFRKILRKFHDGHVLVTIATGEMTDAEADRAGLVPTHAYAMLDIQEIQGKRLFLLKNPWSHLRWKGNYSEKDTVNWTQSLRKELNYDPQSAQMFDNGVFWIDYDSIYRFFDVVYMNWNPSLFTHTYCIHQTWKTGSGPVKDIYNISDNPQYSLEVKPTSASAVWILLTRHITDKEDFAQNREYITVLVYKNDGKKVYYPYDPPPYIDGTRINSPHYLCKMMVDSSGITRYTLVISQYEKTNTIHYTLRVYSTCPFSLSKIGNPFKFHHEVTNGEWKGITAGGCGNNPQTYKHNPIYQVQLSSSSDDNDLLIDLKGPKEYQVGFDIIAVTVNNPNAKGYFTRKASGPFRSGFVILAIENIPAGIYNIIPCTFTPRQESPFFLKFQASCPIKVSRLQ